MGELRWRLHTGASATNGAWSACQSTTTEAAPPVWRAQAGDARGERRGGLSAPVESSRGPPLFPGLIAASVCSMSDVSTLQRSGRELQSTMHAHWWTPRYTDTAMTRALQGARLRPNCSSRSKSRSLAFFHGADSALCMGPRFTCCVQSRAALALTDGRSAPGTRDARLQQRRRTAAEHAPTESAERFFHLVARGAPGWRPGSGVR